jgi:hypothetical protein
MDIVLRAFDARLRRVIAVKALAPALAATGSARQRFVREARAAAAVLLPAAGLGLAEVAGATGIWGTLDRRSVADRPRVAAPAVEPLTEAERWERSVAEPPAEEQVEAVERRLLELNPGFSGKVDSGIHDGKVRRLAFLSDYVTEISPVPAH